MEQHSDTCTYPRNPCACKQRSEIAEKAARDFHETYERLAPKFGYETRKESAVPWENVPDKNKRLMIAVCAEVVERAIAESQAWISVEEKLSAEDERIVVWNSGTGAEEHSTFADGRFIDESGTNTDLTDGITHWKPLADPPKGNENG